MLKTALAMVGVATVTLMFVGYFHCKRNNDRVMRRRRQTLIEITNRNPIWPYEIYQLSQAEMEGIQPMLMPEN